MGDKWSSNAAVTEFNDVDTGVCTKEAKRSEATSQLGVEAKDEGATSEAAAVQRQGTSSGSSPLFGSHGLNC